MIINLSLLAGEDTERDPPQGAQDTLPHHGLPAQQPAWPVPCSPVSLPLGWTLPSAEGPWAQRPRLPQPWLGRTLPQVVLV